MTMYRGKEEEDRREMEEKEVERYNLEHTHTTSYLPYLRGTWVYG